MSRLQEVRRLMKRRVYRAWVQTAVLAGVMAAFLLISLSIFTVADDRSRDDPASVALYSVIGVGSLIGMWFALRMGAAVDDHGIHIRNFGRGRFIPWRDVMALSCEVCDSRLGLPLYAPVVHLAAPDSDEEAGLPLTALGSYRATVAQRRTAALAAFVPSQPTDG